MANYGIVIVGIFLLLGGLGASLYYESMTIFGVEYMRTYPYQNVGIALIVAGALIAGIGAIVSPQKNLPQEPRLQSQPTPSYQTVPQATRPQRRCPNCGTELQADDIYCRKCGTVLPT